MANSINPGADNLYKIQQIQIVNQIEKIIPLIATRTEFSDNDIKTFSISKSCFSSWQVGYDYKKDWIVRYNDELYRIGQDHTSQEQWTPGAEGTDSLYSKIEFTSGGYEIWQEWDGVSGSYSNGQIVQDPTDNQLYISKIDSNVWGPPSEQSNYWELYEA